jgi:hypothetical protein
MANDTASSFTWLDYSEHERRQVMEFVDQFSDDETRDELNLGLGQSVTASRICFFPAQAPFRLAHATSSSCHGSAWNWNGKHARFQPRKEPRDLPP